MQIAPPDISGISGLLAERGGGVNTFRSLGSITKIVGMTVESHGPMASIGDLVKVRAGSGHTVERLAEVVGFRDNRVLLMPFDTIDGVKCGDRVELVGDGFSINVGPELLGRVLDGIGRPIDNGPPPSGERWHVRRPAPESMMRRRIKEPFYTGVRCIDAILPCGRGQRMGIFSGSGVGKSTLLGMICRNASSDLNVVALIGERGKEVLEFMEDCLGEEGLRKTIVIVTTSDKPALQRVKGAEVAMSIAEYFRDAGNDVLFVMDSVTRYAMAQREIGLSIGEPPATKGYPPSVFSLLPCLLERAGTNQLGSITAFFTILVEGDDMSEPVADTVRSILDGHMVLSREIAAHGHYPAIDILPSVSRVISDVASKEHIKLAQELRKLVSVYRKAEDMINIGAYKNGSNAEIDRSMLKKNAIDSFLTQNTEENAPWEETFAALKEVLA